MTCLRCNDATGRSIVRPALGCGEDMQVAGGVLLYEILWFVEFEYLYKIRPSQLDLGQSESDHLFVCLTLTATSGTGTYQLMTST